MYKKKRIDDIMDFWFGDLKVADLPGNDRTRLWFGGGKVVDKEISDEFLEDMNDAIAGKLDDWAKTPRGRLALILIFDQFSRNIFRNTKEAFAQDKMALALCIEGLKKQDDHTLTLIQRVFFYMPLEHSERIDMQEQSVAAFQALADITLPETASVYHAFLRYAVMHFEVIRQFGRFPHRNVVLGRESTEAEALFLAQSHD